MNNRNKKAYVYTAFTLLMMLSTAFFVITAGRTYRIKNEPVYAVDISWHHMESGLFSVDHLLDYVDKTGINTVILPLNNRNNTVAKIDGMNYIFSVDEKYDKADFINRLKNKLARKKAQLFISIDCDYVSQEEITDIAEFISNKYKPAAVILNNSNYDVNTLADIKSVISENSKKTDIIYQTESLSEISTDIFDYFICERMNADSYIATKDRSHGDLKLLLFRTSPSVESDSFVLANFADFDGLVAVHYTGENTPDKYLQTVINPVENIEKFGFTVSDNFTVTYPTKDFTTYYSGVFVTGTGADNTVNINGTEYLAADDGTFGVYLPLEKGDNIITVTNGEKTYTFTATKKVYKNSTVKYEKPWDDTEYLAPGRVVKTTAQLTSMLSNPDDDSAIIAGIEPETKLIVKESVQTERNGYKTYAYRLSNGGYVLASKVEITDEITEDYQYDEKEDISDYSSFEKIKITSVSLERLKNNDEHLIITATDNPAAVHSFSEEKLSLLLLDTEAENIPLPKSQFYTDYSVTQTNAGTVIELALNTDNPLWGYDVKCENGKITVYLKHAPMLSLGTEPLKNVTILLDPGHGGKDSGALGVASTNGPLEKDLNLAVSKATKTVLEQYGATVYMTREDDSFPSLDDRRNMVRDIKPDLFIAQHHNSMDYSYNSTNAVGSECYYFTHQSENLAHLLCENITAATGRTNRGAFNGYYYVTRTDIAPSVLMEYSFMINPHEFARTYSDEAIYKAAFGTVQAVLKAIPQ